MKATKIVCTLGPASCTPEVMKEMLKAGMNVARLNCSHGSHEEHLEKMVAFRQACEELDLPAAILLDTKGPEIRLGTFAEHKVLLKKGQQFILRQPASEGSAASAEASTAGADASAVSTDASAASAEALTAGAEEFAVSAEEYAAGAEASPVRTDASASGTAEQLGNAKGVSISYGGLAALVSPGTRILVDDGKIRMNVLRVEEGNIICEVLDEGYVSTKKGVNVPDIHLDMEFLSEKDQADLLFGIEQEVDFIAASFVRSVEDVNDLRKFLNENGGEQIKIISKIENPEGIHNFDEILDASDGIMIARGDMGVEVDYATLPGIQKFFIQKCNRKGKPVITATQMLESMITEPMPTRAEITDVANAVFDGTTAVMLSGESAAGKYPAQTVAVMSRIVSQAEEDMRRAGIRAKGTETYLEEGDGGTDLSTAIGHAACQAADDIGATALIAITCSGYTARMMSRFHPDQPIIGATPWPRAARAMALLRGVIPVMTKTESDFDQLVKAAIAGASCQEVLASGDRVVISAGLPLNEPGNTNIIRVVTV